MAHDGLVSRLLSSSRAPRALVAFAVLFALPSIAVGFYSDDWALRATLAGRARPGVPWWDLYRFYAGDDAAMPGMIARGEAPWWTAPGLKVHLVRPFAGALLAIDERLFGDRAFGWHLHSIAWWALLALAVALVHRRVLPARTATLATLLFVLGPAAAMPYAWISARHILVAAAPALLGLVAYVRACEDRWRAGRWWCALGMGVGMVGGEAAVGAVVLAASYAALGPEPKGGGGFRARAKHLLPTLAVAALYVALYRAMGGGASGGDGYVDPVGHPIAFARAAAVRAPALFANAALPFALAELVIVMPPAIFVVLGALTTFGVAWLLRASWPRLDPRERAALRWLLPGAVLALVVSVGGFPGGRVLVVPNVAFAALFAAIILRGVGRTAVVVLHVGLAPLVALFGVKSMIDVSRRMELVTQRAEVPPPPRGSIFVVNASDPFASMYLVAQLTARDAERSCWSFFSSARLPHRVTRTGARTIALEPIGGTWLTGAFETLFRSESQPLAVGATFEQCGATIRVAAIENDHPTRVEVELPRSADDAWLVTWQDGRLARFHPPASGASVVLPWSPGPSGMF